MIFKLHQLLLEHFAICVLCFRFLIVFVRSLYLILKVFYLFLINDFEIGERLIFRKCNLEFLLNFSLCGIQIALQIIILIFNRRDNFLFKPFHRLISVIVKTNSMIFTFILRGNSFLIYLLSIAFKSLALEVRRVN